MLVTWNAGNTDYEIKAIFIGISAVFLGNTLVPWHRLTVSLK
jgi:hypothetical protein